MNRIPVVNADEAEARDLDRRRRASAFALVGMAGALAAIGSMTAAVFLGAGGWALAGDLVLIPAELVVFGYLARAWFHLSPYPTDRNHDR